MLTFSLILIFLEEKLRKKNKLNKIMTFLENVIKAFKRILSNPLIQQKLNFTILHKIGMV
jgi:hypothetical protein